MLHLLAVSDPVLSDPSAVPTMAEAWAGTDVYVFFAVAAFFYGLLFGSFFNVAIYRLPLGLSVNKPRRSFCFRCGSPIRWYDNIPVLSYLLLGGKDRACGARISPRYALVELLTGLIFLGLYLMHNAPGAYHLGTLWYAGFAGILIIGTFTDFDHWIIPGQIPVIGAIGALIAALLMGFVDPVNLLTIGGPFPALRLEWGDPLAVVEAMFLGPATLNPAGDLLWRASDVQWWEPLANSLIGAFFASFLVYGVGVVGKIIFRKDAMGFGDVQLFFVIGATVGPFYSVVVLVLASFFGSVGGGMLKVWERLRQRDAASPILSAGRDALLLEAETSRDEAPAQTPPAGPIRPLIDIPDFSSPEEEREAQRSLAESLEIPYLSLEGEEAPASDALALLPADLRTRWLAAAVRRTPQAITVAVVDTQNSLMIQEIREALKEELAAGRRLEFAIAPPSALKAICGLREETAYHPVQLTEGREDFEPEDVHTGQGAGTRSSEQAQGEEKVPLEATAEQDKFSDFSEAVENSGTAATVPVWERLYATASKLPRGKAVHHVPFIPWIALGGLVFLIFFPFIQAFIAQFFFPFAAGAGDIVYP
ncbi:MAG: prepilin peptidase [Sumerlaeia bacterium]